MLQNSLAYFVAVIIAVCVDVAVASNLLLRWVVDVLPKNTWANREKNLTGNILKFCSCSLRISISKVKLKLKDHFSTTKKWRQIKCEILLVSLG